MEIKQEVYTISLEKAKRALQTADHLTYMTFPLIKENRLLLKILDELRDSIVNIINAILQYEYIYKRISLYKDSKENFRTFIEVAKKYKIEQKQVNKIIEILRLAEEHKKSPLEFTKKDKVVILKDDLKIDTLTPDKIKSFLLETKDFLRKISTVVK